VRGSAGFQQLVRDFNGARAAQRLTPNQRNPARLHRPGS
jgi:hypothetical protein